MGRKLALGFGLLAFAALARLPIALADGGDRISPPVHHHYPELKTVTAL